jgi:hippurate hydrolase
VDGFTITITGRGGHAAAPKNAIDPLLCGAAIVTALQGFVSRDADPIESGVLTVSQFHAGSSFNVIADTAMLNGTIRALSKESREKILGGLERIAREVAAKHGCTVAFEYFGTTPCTNNTPEMAEFVANVATKVLGEKGFVWAPQPAMWGEDFAFYLERVPGCFFVLGVQPHDLREYPMLHNPKFDFTDAAIPYGIKMMAGAAVEFLSR